MTVWNMEQDQAKSMFCNREYQSRNNLCSFHYCSGLLPKIMLPYVWLMLLISNFQFQLIALGVGLIPTLRKLLIGNTAPLRVIEDSVSLLGYSITTNCHFFNDVENV